jgi:HAE1 family hydrophobic/amphiphilic exporter-1
MALALSGKLSPRDLTKLAEDVVKQRLSRLKGVGNVEIVGGRPREIHVVIDPGRLAARGLTPGDVSAALDGQNVELPAGRITENAREVVVTTKGAFTSVQQVADAPITLPGGPTDANAQVRIGDVAQAIDDRAEARSHASPTRRTRSAWGPGEGVGANPPTSRARSAPRSPRWSSRSPPTARS